MLVNNAWIKTVTSPYADENGDFEELTAVPALELDVALVHLNRADVHGNATYLGPDPYFDDLFVQAADKAFAQRASRSSTPPVSRSTPLSSGC